MLHRTSGRSPGSGPAPAPLFYETGKVLWPKKRRISSIFKMITALGVRKHLCLRGCKELSSEGLRSCFRALVLPCNRAFVHYCQTMLGSGNPKSEVLNPKSEQLAFDHRVPGSRFNVSRFRSVGGASVRRFRHECTEARLHERTTARAHERTKGGQSYAILSVFQKERQTRCWTCLGEKKGF